MEAKKKYKELIEQIKQGSIKTGSPITNTEISRRLGYKREHFQLLIGPNGKVTDKHIEDLLLRFPEVSDNITKAMEPAPVEQNQNDMNTDMESRRTLERTLENMSEDKIRSTAIIERLVALLEHSFSSSSPGPAVQQPLQTDKTADLPPGSGHLGLGKKKSQASRH